MGQQQTLDVFWIADSVVQQVPANGVGPGVGMATRAALPVLEADRPIIKEHLTATLLRQFRLWSQKNGSKRLIGLWTKVDNGKTITVKPGKQKLLVQYDDIKFTTDMFTLGRGDNPDLRVELLDKKQIDAFSADQVVLIGQVIARGGRERYALSTELFSFEPFALAVPRGDADFQLVADRVLSQLNRSGGIVKIYKRWFGSFGEELPSGLRALYQLNSTPL